MHKQFSIFLQDHPYLMRKMFDLYPLIYALLLITMAATDATMSWWAIALTLAFISILAIVNYIISTHKLCHVVSQVMDLRKCGCRVWIPDEYKVVKLAMQSIYARQSPTIRSVVWILRVTSLMPILIASNSRQRSDCFFDLIIKYTSWALPLKDREGFLNLFYEQISQMRADGYSEMSIRTQSLIDLWPAWKRIVCSGLFIASFIVYLFA